VFLSIYKLNFMIDKEYFAESSDNILWKHDPYIYLKFSFVVKVFFYVSHQRLLNHDLVPTLAGLCKENSTLHLRMKSIQKSVF
jgi:hypothetical protein